MKKHNFFKKIYLSISKLSFYTNVIHEKLYKSIFYLVILTILISIPYSVFFGNYIYKETTDILTLMESKTFPNFYLENNELIIEGETPFVISDEEQKTFKIIIDNTSTYSFNDLAGYYWGYLITPKNIIQSQLGSTPKTVTYDKVLLEGFSKDILLLELKTLQPLLAIFSSVFTIVFFIISNFFKSLMAYFIVLFFRNIYRVPLSNVQAYKIAVYSMTAGLILLEGLRFVQLVPPSFFFGIFMMINSVYVGKILFYFNKLKTDLSA